MIIVILECDEVPAFLKDYYSFMHSPSKEELPDESGYLKNAVRDIAGYRVSMARGRPYAA